MQEPTSHKEQSIGYRLLRNFGILLGGRTAAALLALGATMLTAASLEQAQFGVVVLLHTYLLVIRGLFNFKPFEAIIKFGVPLLDSANTSGFRHLLGFSLRLDAFSCILAALGGFLLIPFVAEWLAWDERIQTIAAVYCLGLLSSGTGTAKGILRIHDRFDALARQLAVGPAVRLLGCLLAWWLNQPFEVFVAVWAISFWVENGYLQLRGWAEYRRQVPASPPGGEVPQALPRGVWGFLSVVYWQSNLDLVPKQVSTLLAGGLLGNEGAAMFRIARDFANVLAKPALLIRQAAFPDLTRLWHRNDPQFYPIVCKTALLSGVAGLTLVLLSVPVSGPLLSSLFGADYVPAAGLMSLLLLAASLDLAAAAFRTSAYAMGRAGSVLWIQAFATGVFVAAFWVFTKSLGLPGPGWAATIAAALGLLGLAQVVTVANRRR